MRVGIAVYCEVCKLMKKPHGRSAPLAASYCDEECEGYTRMPFAGCLWPNETEDEFGYSICRDATREVPDEAVKGEG